MTALIADALIKTHQYFHLEIDNTKEIVWHSMRFSPLFRRCICCHWYLVIDVVFVVVNESFSLVSSSSSASSSSSSSFSFGICSQAFRLRLFDIHTNLFVFVCDFFGLFLLSIVVGGVGFYFWSFFGWNKIQYLSYWFYVITLFFPIYYIVLSQVLKFTKFNNGEKHQVAEMFGGCKSKS